MRLLGIVLLVALVVSGCAQSLERDAELVDVYFVGDTPRGFKLFSERNAVESAGEDVVTHVMSDLVSGEIQPLDPDYVNLWDSSHSLNSVSYSGTRAVIDLSLGKLNVGAEAEARAIDQLVWTLTGINPSITEVTILVDGSRVESLAGHVDATQAFERGAELEVLSPIQILSIGEGDELVNPVIVSGEACTFEANVLWELTDSNGKGKQGFSTAEAACPNRSPWTLELGTLDPGSYSFRAFETSAEDGSLVAEDTKAFTVR